MDSLKIAPRLEAMQAEPSLRLNDDRQQQLAKSLGQAINPLMPVFMARVHRGIITDAELDWFRQDRERRCGMSLEQWEGEKGGETAWKAAGPGFEQLSKVLKEYKQDEGPFILGSKPCYTDFAVAGPAEFFLQTGQDMYERLVGNVEGLRELHDACKPWFERNDH